MNIETYIKQAALAAGHVVQMVGKQVWINGDYESASFTTPWNPHEDSAKALSLMVAMDFKVEINKGLKYTTVARNRDINTFELFVRHEEYTSPEAATRIAIVLAAAKAYRLKTE